MMSPVFDSFEDDWIAMEAMYDDEEWMQWNKEAFKLQVKLEYFIMEFL